MSGPLAWRAEEACLNAWPALGSVIQGDWIARFADGLTRRANSVNPLSADASGLADGLAGFAALYRAHGLPLIVRVPTLLDPSIDRHLAEAGFAAEGETCTLYGGIADVAAVADADVRWSARPDPTWLAAFNTFHARSAQESETFRRIVERIALPTAFVSLHDGGEIASVALGALHDGLLCVESVVTSDRARGRGLGVRMLGTLFAWAKDNGAQGICLQVEASNTAGRALYHRLGLRSELSRYHYRREPKL